MRRLALVLAALCLPFLLVLPAAAQGAPTVTVTDHPQLGNILTDAQGKTLYIFTRDEANASTCYDQCAQRWPALTVTGRRARAVRHPGRDHPPRQRPAADLQPDAALLLLRR